MRVRQSDLKTWQKCPLMYKFQNLDNLPRLQSGALSFGTIIHDCVLYMEVNQDLDGALNRFRAMWLDPEAYDAQLQPPGQTLKIDYYNNGSNWKKYAAQGEKILRDWWEIIKWDSDVVLGREYTFEVPIGDGHVLTGTLDKLALRYLPKMNQQVLLISDYKTSQKAPTYGWLEDDLQFTAYSYATTQPEFWEGLPDGMYERLKDLPRYGEWVHLQGPKRMDAGIREQNQYNRLIYAVNALSMSVAMRIFVPNISGESCRYCEFRENCGLPEIMEVETY